MSFIKLIKKFLFKLGIDKTIAYSSGARLNAAFSGVILIFFVARFLTKTEQGFYYTFGSILAIQIFFELGLNNIITQYVAHETSHLKWKDSISLEGEEKYLSRVAHLLRFSVKWYSYVGIFFFFILVGVGIWFFGYYSTQNEDENICWFIPWILVCVGAVLNLFISPLMAIIMGLNKVKDVMKMRFYQQLIIPVSTLMGLMLGFHLYVLGIASILSVFYVIIYGSITNLRPILNNLWHKEITEKVSYKSEILPYQWRIALSWLSGYFIYQLFNPVLFANHGAVVAGQMGMTIQVLNGINALSFSWITTKTPIFAGLIAQNNYSQLDRLFNSTIKQMSFICVTLLIIMIGGVEALRFFDVPLGFRFLPFLSLIFMSAALVINQFISAWAQYLRCHKQEPYMIYSIILGIACSASTIILGKYYGALGMSLGYFCIIFLSSFWAYTIYKKCKIIWHGINE